MTNANIPSHINVGESVQHDATDEEICKAFLPQDVSLIEHAHISYNKRVTLTELVWQSHRTAEHAMSSENQC